MGIAHSTLADELETQLLLTQATLAKGISFRWPLDRECGVSHARGCGKSNNACVPEVRTHSLLTQTTLAIFAAGYL